MNLPCLDIIIPHYKEQPKMIRHLLDSIEMQTGISLAKAIRVTIVNDKNDETYNALINYLQTAQYGYPIKVLQTAKNGGAGLARQFGIDNTNLPYIMFCDADDCLWDCSSLLKLLNQVRLIEVQGKKWNYVWGDFMEEKTAGNGYDFIKHDTPSMIWMHGKIWNRKFLQEHNIKFHPWLRTFEDTYFGKIVSLCAPKTAYHHCPETVYFWKRNPDSVTANWTKDERSYLFWRNEDYIECTYGVMKFVYPYRQENGRWHELFFVSLMFTYFLLQMDDLAPKETKEYPAAYYNTEALFVKLIKDFGESVKESSPKERAYWYSLTRSDVVSRFNFVMEKISWNDFLKNIDKKYDLNCYSFLYIK